ncbi:alkaline phosphatase family protein [Caenorhabditis elegans]|uniref:Uncharacterized protein n=1 Tax=Caenorhabditis elegans TaxID=6239 RepID=Q21671_CAEEL|nr:Uncharacterized protein CELE_R03G8.1 [Caenorhabditis elegans]CAA93679.2 Uncharacterized protein CELE_R03G8.1 [Caenorhabditis elegans]|eukprot:NP_510172.2 Uncharacterized protein CELE_R03G8.1 [Caenorhabditis elegans]
MIDPYPLVKRFYELPWILYILVCIAFTYSVSIVIHTDYAAPVTEDILVGNSWDTCELPRYDVWDEELFGYLNPNENPLKKCDTSFKPLTKLENSKWGVTFAHNLTCRARCHTRKRDKENLVGNWTYTPGKINCEILETVCAEKGGEQRDVYGYLHSQIIPTKPKLSRTNADLKEYDVFVILLDSLSYSQAARSLPRTVSFFKSYMKGIIFPYMNKVGDNSRPNGVALWFGKLLEKVDRFIFDKPSLEADWTDDYFCNVFKDNETSLFDEFKTHGYKTLMAEDWALGTLIWPNCLGYRNQSIDHYMRPFQLAHEKYGTPVTREHLNGSLCREDHNTLLDYLAQFLDAYSGSNDSIQLKREKSPNSPDQRKFAFLWTTRLGHATENGFDATENGSDNDFLNFFIKHRKKLEDSFVLLLGDHGFRLGGVRNTAVGAIDVNNPLTAISVPNSLRTNTDILKILNMNSEKLQTHFDTRATILDILKFQPAEKFSAITPLQIPGEKGQSHLRNQPPFNRNCQTMPIPFEYCICQFNKTSVPINSTISMEIGEKVAENVNKLLQINNFTSECISMVFERTESLLQYNQKLGNSTIYTVIAQMKKPSEAKFKATVKITEGNIKIVSKVERVDSYGKTADCIESETHRPICYCKEQPKQCSWTRLNFELFVN